MLIAGRKVATEQQPQSNYASPQLQGFSPSEGGTPGTRQLQPYAPWLDGSPSFIEQSSWLAPEDSLIGQPCINTQGHASGRDVQRLQKIVQQLTELVADDASFGGAAPRLDMRQQSQSSLDGRVIRPGRLSPQRHFARHWGSPEPLSMHALSPMHGMQAGGASSAMRMAKPAAEMTMKSPDKAVSPGKARTARQNVAVEDSAEAIAAADAQVAKITRQAAAEGSPDPGLIKAGRASTRSMLHARIKDIACAAFAELAQQCARQDKAHAVMQLWGSLADFLDRAAGRSDTSFDEASQASEQMAADLAKANERCAKLGSELEQARNEQEQLRQRLAEAQASAAREAQQALQAQQAQQAERDAAQQAKRGLEEKVQTLQAALVYKAQLLEQAKQAADQATAQVATSGTVHAAGRCKKGRQHSSGTAQEAIQTQVGNTATDAAMLSGQPGTAAAASTSTSSSTGVSSSSQTSTWAPPTATAVTSPFLMPQGQPATSEVGAKADNSRFAFAFGGTSSAAAPNPWQLPNTATKPAQAGPFAFGASNAAGASSSPFAFGSTAAEPTAESDSQAVVRLIPAPMPSTSALAPIVVAPEPKIAPPGKAVVQLIPAPVPATSTSAPIVAPEPKLAPAGKAVVRLIPSAPMPASATQGPDVAPEPKTVPDDKAVVRLIPAPEPQTAPPGKAIVRLIPAPEPQTAPAGKAVVKLVSAPEPKTAPAGKAVVKLIPAPEPITVPAGKAVVRLVPAPMPVTTTLEPIAVHTDASETSNPQLEPQQPVSSTPLPNVSNGTTTGAVSPTTPASSGTGREGSMRTSSAIPAHAITISSQPILSSAAAIDPAPLGRSAAQQEDQDIPAASNRPPLTGSDLELPKRVSMLRSQSVSRMGSQASIADSLASADFHSVSSQRLASSELEGDDQLMDAESGESGVDDESEAGALDETDTEDDDRNVDNMDAESVSSEELHVEQPQGANTHDEVDDDVVSVLSEESSDSDVHPLNHDPDAERQIARRPCIGNIASPKTLSASTSQADLSTVEGTGHRDRLGHQPSPLSEAQVAGSAVPGQGAPHALNPHRFDLPNPDTNPTLHGKVTLFNGVMRNVRGMHDEVKAELRANRRQRSSEAQEAKQHIQELEGTVALLREHLNRAQELLRGQALNTLAGLRSASPDIERLLLQPIAEGPVGASGASLTTASLPGPAVGPSPATTDKARFPDPVAALAAASPDDMWVRKLAKQTTRQAQVAVRSGQQYFANGSTAKPDVKTSKAEEGTIGDEVAGIMEASMARLDKAVETGWMGAPKANLHRNFVRAVLSTAGAAARLPCSAYFCSTFTQGMESTVLTTMAQLCHDNAIASGEGGSHVSPEMRAEALELVRARMAKQNTALAAC